MSGQNSYIDSQNFKNIEKTEKVLNTLPFFVNLFFEAKKDKMTTKTILGYAYDFSKFFSWAKLNIFKDKKSVQDITLKDLESISDEDINRYVFFLQTDSDSFNSNISIRRKISSLSSLYNYFYEHGYVDENPCKYVEYPDFITADNVCLTKEQIDALLSQIINADDVYTDKQISYINKTRIRDYTIISLLLMTGIRIAECVALDINSVDFKNKILIVLRNKVNIRLPLSDAVIDILSKYKKERDKLSAETSALFVSMQGQRMCVQAVEDMIKKHTEPLSLPFVVTPKVFRHTFAARMFEISASIDLVNSYLGKKKVEEIRILMNHLTEEQKEKVYSILNQMF